MSNLRLALPALVALSLVLPTAARAACSVKAGDTSLTADLDRGRRTFLKCRACHTLKEKEANLVGPNLWKVLGRPALGAAAFAYSPAFTAAKPQWTPETLDQFVEKPAKTIAGTKMVFAGIASAQERADLIAWLGRETGTPLPGCP